MLDSGWLKGLRQAGPGFFVIVAIVAGVLSVLWRVVPGTVGIPHPSAPAIADTIFIGSVVIALSLWLWRLITHLAKTPEEATVRQLKRRYQKLGTMQVQLLHEVYTTGSRSFDAPIPLVRQRLFEELSELGFVRYVSSPITFLGGETMPYEITVAAWEVIGTKIP